MPARMYNASDSGVISLRSSCGSYCINTNSQTTVNFHPRHIFNPSMCPALSV